MLPGSLDERASGLAEKEQLIWLPQDSTDSIRAVSAVREERLAGLQGLRSSGVLNEDEFVTKRKEVIHAEFPTSDDHVHDESCSHGHGHGHHHHHHHH